MQGPSDPPLRALIVDDDVDTSDSLALLLRMWGHEVRTTHDGHSALRMACEFRPDAVLLDIGRPHLDGFEVAVRRRALPDFARSWRPSPADPLRLLPSPGFPGGHPRAERGFPSPWVHCSSNVSSSLGSTGLTR